MKKLTERDLKLDVRNVYNLSQKQPLVRNANVGDNFQRLQGEQKETGGACLHADGIDTKVTCVNTYDDCDDVTFGDECVYTKNCATENCASRVCTRSDDYICCDKTHQDTCWVQLSQGGNCYLSNECETNLCQSTDCLYTGDCVALSSEDDDCPKPITPDCL